MRQAILYQGEDGYWIAEVPSLPGCVTQGATRDEALENAAEAAALWIECVTELGERVPPETQTAEVVWLKAS